MIPLCCLFSTGQPKWQVTTLYRTINSLWRLVKGSRKGNLGSKFILKLAPCVLSVLAVNIHFFLAMECDPDTVNYLLWRPTRQLFVTPGDKFLFHDTWSDVRLKIINIRCIFYMVGELGVVILMWERVKGPVNAVTEMCNGFTDSLITHSRMGELV